MIDRRMINGFLVQYVDEKSDDQVKAHMLEAMSKILGFSMEEKQKLGLIKKVEDKTETAQAAAAKSGGFGSSLVSFLMGDDDFE